MAAQAGIHDVSLVLSQIRTFQEIGNARETASECLPVAWMAAFAAMTGVRFNCSATTAGRDLARIYASADIDVFGGCDAGR